MILVDANILMYAAGGEHPCKEPSARFLTQIAKGEIDAVVDAETLQELLHRYRALRRWEDGRILFDSARVLFPSVIAITADILDGARLLLDKYPHLMARDALHAPVVNHHGFDAICSFDRDFDQVDEIRRIEPQVLRSRNKH
jgi:predicted nucleic acid-binding protein